MPSDEAGKIRICVFAKRHVEAGAPREFYKGNHYFVVILKAKDVDGFVKSRGDDWLRDLPLLERTVGHPDSCHLEKPKSVIEEFAWNERMTLKRTEGNITCTCTLMKIDGCLYVPLLGKLAPKVEVRKDE